MMVRSQNFTMIFSQALFTRLPNVEFTRGNRPVIAEKALKRAIEWPPASAGSAADSRSCTLYFLQRQASGNQ